MDSFWLPRASTGQTLETALEVYGKNSVMDGQCLSSSRHFCLVSGLGFLEDVQPPRERVIPLCSKALGSSSAAVGTPLEESVLTFPHLLY